MGLRLQGLISILVLSLGLGGLGLTLLTRHLDASFEALERARLREDLRRLQTGLHLAVSTRLRTAREWSHWTELRDHLLRPSERFRAHQLSPASLQVSGYDWMLLLRTDGGLIEALAAPGIAPPTPAQIERAWRLRKMPPVGGLCALDRWQQRLMVICQLPVLDSEAREPAAGILVTAEAFEERHLAGLRTLFGMPFALLPASELPAGEPQPDLPDVVMQTAADHIRVQWLLRVGDEPPHSLMRMDWPRELRAQRERALAGGQAVLAGVALLLALAALLLIDWRLVRRLRRLQRSLAALRGDERWSERLPEEGRDEISALAGEANHLLARIETQMQRLAEQGRTDALTGLLNRRGFEESLAAALARARRDGRPLALMLLDADHFKRFNDAHGHAAGDRALQVLARGLREQGARRAGTDLAARWGGEEFTLLLESCPPELAVQRYAALRSWLQAQPSGEGAELAAPLRVSAGVALARPDDSGASLLQRADEALYRAKAAGRDQLVIG